MSAPTPVPSRLWNSSRLASCGVPSRRRESGRGAHDSESTAPRRDRSRAVRESKNSSVCLLPRSFWRRALAALAHRIRCSSRWACAARIPSGRTLVHAPTRAGAGASSPPYCSTPPTTRRSETSRTTGCRCSAWWCSLSDSRPSRWPSSLTRSCLRCRGQRRLRLVPSSLPRTPSPQRRCCGRCGRRTAS